MDQIINLNRNDDIIQVRSLVEWSDGRRIIIVAPRGARALDSEHELRLIHRWADDADVSVALVTDEYKLRETAAAAGIPVFTSVGKAQKSNWNWKRNGSTGVARSTALDDLRAVPKQALLDRLGLAGAQLVFTLIIFAIAAGILAVAAIFVVPSARITIYPAAVGISDSREVILDSTVTTIDQINNILPATSFRREISGTTTIATTKVDTAPADLATGKVVFTNLAGTQAAIPAGTIVQTSSGVTTRFATTAAATLPAGYNARVTVPIQALDQGPAGNVKALQINTIQGPLSAIARVINTEPLGGGGIKQVRLVTFEDKQKLRQILGNQLRAAAVARIQKEAGDSTFIAPASVQVSVLTETFDHLVDDPADSLSLHVEAVATGMAVDRADLDKFAERILIAKVPKGYAVLPGTMHVEADQNARAEGSSIIFALRSSMQVTPQVKASEILKGLAGKSPQDAAETIGGRINLSEPARIETSPGWWPRLPLLDWRLALFVKGEPDAAAGHTVTP